MARFESDLLEACHSFRDASSFATWTLGHVDRLVGFDSAIMVRGDQSRPLAQRNKEPYLHLVRRLATQPSRYQPGLVKGGLAAGAKGAYLDTEVYSTRERQRLPFYVDVVRPQGITSQICAVPRFLGSNQSIMYLCRHGSQFRPRDLERIRRVMPMLGMAQAALAAHRERSPLLFELTPREQEIVSYVCRGFRNLDIAAVLGTSVNTVRNQLLRLFEKAGVANRAELVALFLRSE